MSNANVINPMIYGSNLNAEFLGGNCWGTDVKLLKDYEYVVLANGGTVNREGMSVSISPVREAVISEERNGVSYNLSFKGLLKVYKDCKMGDKIHMGVNPGCAFAIGFTSKN